MVWYAHPKLLTFKLTALPAGYPTGFDFPPGVTPNVAEYMERGWYVWPRSHTRALAPTSHTRTAVLSTHRQVLLRGVGQRHGQGL